MVEIKFLKELPVRSLNKSELIKLNGADIYVDKDANRFAFFGFKNYLRSPMFSLYLVIKQYDSFGSFIKETKFSLPSIFVKRGDYVIEKPVRISDECEGCEVYIAYAEFASKQFYQDRLMSKPHLEDFTQNYFAGAPTSVTCSINSNIVIEKEEAKPEVSSGKEEPKVSFEEVAKPEEAKPEEIASTENKEEAKPEEASKDVPVGETPIITSRRRHMSFANLGLLGGALGIFIILAIVLNAIF